MAEMKMAPTVAWVKSGVRHSSGKRTSISWSSGKTTSSKMTSWLPLARRPRRSQVGLDAKRVDQGNAIDRLPGQPAGQAGGPARAARHHEVLNVMHRQDERGRRIGLADNAENTRRLRSARAAAAKRGRDGQG